MLTYFNALRKINIIHIQTIRLNDLQQKGFSLIELLISLALSLLIISTLTTTYIHAHKMRESQIALMQIKQTILLTNKLLGLELSKANYRGNTVAADNFSGTQATKNKLTKCKDSNWTLKLIPGLYSSSDKAKDYPCLKSKANQYLQGEIITSRYVGSKVIAHIWAKKAYVRNSLYRNKIFLGLDKNKPNNLLANSSPLKNMHSNTYFVGRNKNIHCKKKIIPGLIRVKRSKGGKLSHQMIFLGLETIHFLFLEKKISLDGNPLFQFKPSSEISHWDRVVAVKASGIARSHCPLFSKNYKSNFILFNQSYDFNDRYLRKQFTFFTRLPNST